jgi:putative endopeptidase
VTAGKPSEVIDGFTPEQRFFIAYAQSINTAIWSEREVATQSLVDGYSHSYPKWRINGVLMNFTPFAVAFGCKEGNSMVRPGAVRWAVW